MQLIQMGSPGESHPRFGNNDINDRSECHKTVDGFLAGDGAGWNSASSSELGFREEGSEL